MLSLQREKHSTPQGHNTAISHNAERWLPYVNRWKQHEWRTTIFADLILSDVKGYDRELTFLDIGCGRGFDDDPKTQEKLAAKSSWFIGIEPDLNAAVGSGFNEVHRCLLEDAPLENDSVDLAWAVMVLEHLDDPTPFWNKIYDSLREGGVFWAFTVDRRHPFPWLSQTMHKLGVKKAYLEYLNRKGQGGDYEHYPTYYHSNSPRQILPFVKKFRRCDFINFVRVGQLDGYLPTWARPIFRCVDHLAILARRPGVLLAIRCEK